ncbi:MAG TPA: TIM barrel protein [Phycisphaerae bacterium]|nr:TIM barrel protein [Phycisphaerae bacterium]HPS52321.1 TIM barrel protein [Phycisphaerae bacterium]
MKIGIQQTSLGEVGLNRCFSAARLSGITGINLCYNTEEEANDLTSKKHLATINVLQKNFKVAPTGLYMGCLNCFESLIGSAESVAKARKMVTDAITAAHAIKCGTVILPFLGRSKIELTDEMLRACNALSILAETAEDYKINLAVITSLTAEQTEMLLGNIGSDYVKICFDIGVAVACRFDAGCMLRRFGSQKIAQVFLKDVWCNTGMPPEFNVRLGRGDAPLSSIAQSLKAIGYDGWVILDTPPGDKSSTIVNSNVEFTKQLLGQCIPA